MQVEFYKHNLGDTEIKAVADVMRSVMLTTGAVTAEFERKFAEYLGVHSALGVMSATHAIELALRALGIQPGDEVIVPAFTMWATAEAVIHAGGKPVFVDSEPETGNINIDLIEKSITARTKAIIPVHLYGQLCDMQRLRELCDRHRLWLVEDSAHNIEGERDGLKAGALSDAACFSFYATKNITCGEGGAVVTNQPQLAELMTVMRTHGMSADAANRYASDKFRHYDIAVLGIKANMSNILAAMLINQVEKLDERWAIRERICQKYEAAFQQHPRIGLLIPKSKSGRHIFAILVEPSLRDEYVNLLRERGVGCVVNWYPMTLFTYVRKTFGTKPGDFPVAEKLGFSTISLPLYPSLTDEEVDYVIKTVLDTIR